MEAVPRLPMLSVELKVSPENTEFGPQLKKYIRDHYHEDPESYSKEIKDLEALRVAAIRVPRDYTGCSTLKRYYSQLYLLQKRFPMTDDGAACVAFMWSDIYSGMVFNITDITYEQACILYNIGSLHSELGAMDRRQTSEGMKISCTHFQCSAWAFQHLRDNFPQPKGSDMSHDLLTFFINIMLAQAQECILEKSMLDNRKSTIIAKVAAQIVDYYKIAQKTLEAGSKNMETGCIAEIVGSKLFKSWQRYVMFKMTYHSCIAFLYMGNQAEEQQKMGERLGYFQAALDKLNEAIKLSKGLDKEEISDALVFTMDVVGGKFETAKKDNEFIYHDKVPALESLPEIKGASLVKGIPFQPTDPEVSGTDIFSRLVPMEMHEASSLYSEEKAKILRKISGDIGEKNQELQTYLTSLQLDQLKLTPETEHLPQELIECCAALSVKPNVIKDLIDSMQSLSSLFHDVESSLEELQCILKEEEEKEKKYQEIMGKRGPSMILLEIQKEVSKYQEAHSKANESNNNLHKAMNLHLPNLRLLTSSLEDIQRALPSVSILDAPNDEASLKELKRLMAKVDEMKNQRQMLETQLREDLQNDDITKHLVAHEGSDVQELFQQEIKKHEKIISFLEQNLAAQDNILKALTAANARYADTRKLTADITMKRENMIKSLIASYEAYEDLLSKSQRGFEFYRKLEGNVSKLLQRTRSVCKVQEEERQQMLEKLKPKDSSFGSKSTDSGPKLKDYLQFMQSSSKPFSTPIQNIKPTNVSYPSDHIIPSDDRDISSRSGMIASDNTMAYDSVPSMSAMYLPRPAPLGSEHSDCVSSQCTSNVEAKSVTFAPANQSVSYPYPNTQTGSHSSMSTASYYAPQPSVPSVPSATYDTANMAQNQYPQMPPFSAATGIANYMPSSIPNAYQVQYQSEPIPGSGIINRSWQPATMSSLAANSMPMSSSSQQPQQQMGSMGTAEMLPSSSVASSPYITSAGMPTTTPYYSGTAFPPLSVQPNQFVSAAYSYYPYNEQYSAAYVPQNITNIPSSANNFIQPAQTEAAHFNRDLKPTAVCNYAVTTTTVSSIQSVPQYTQAGLGTAETKVASGYLQYNNQQPQPQTSLNSQVFTSPSLVQPHPYMSDCITSGYTQPTVPASTQAQFAGTDQGIPGNTYQTPSSAAARPVSESTSTPPVTTTTDRPKAGSDVHSSNVSQLHHPSELYGIYYNDSNISNTNAINYDMTYTSVPTSYNMTYQYSQYSSGNSFSNYSTPALHSTVSVPSTTNSAFSLGQSTAAVGIDKHPCLNVSIKKSDSNVHLLNQLQTPEESVYDSQGKKPTPGIHLPTSLAAVTLPSVTGTSPCTSTSASAFSSACSVQHLHDKTGAILDSFDPMQEKFKEKDVILKPKVLTVEEIQQKNIMKPESQRAVSKDPYSEPENLNRFVSDVERFEKIVEGLTKQSLKGPTPLDQKWKELMDTQDRESRKLAISVARCYSLKNRLADVMPYDVTRVKLTSIHDDYINASYIKEISQCSVQFIATQAPLPCTIADFWMMMFEQQSEIIVCLMSDAELKTHIYWPLDKGQQLSFGSLNVGLQSMKTKSWGIERMITVTHMQTRITRVVIHLQCTIWPPSENPSNICHFLTLITDTLSYYQQQRNLARPLIVHCSAGIGRTGVFCLITAAILDINSGRGIIDVSSAASQMIQMRKSIIQDKNQLQFCYSTLLYYAQDLLMKRGILSGKPAFEDKLPTTPKSHTRHPSEDFILGIGDLNKLKSGVEKLGTDKQDDVNLKNEINASKDKQFSQSESHPPPGTEIDISISKISAGQDKTKEDDDRHSVASGISEQVLSRSNSVASVASAASSGSLVATDSPQHSVNKGPILPASLAKLDAANFSLEPLPSKGKRKITRESFLNPNGSTLSQGTNDSSDPLSLLDPLWTHHK